MKIHLIDCASPDWLSSNEEMLSSVRIGNLSINEIYNNFFDTRIKENFLRSELNTEKIFWPIRYFPSITANNILHKLNAYLTTYAGITFVTKEGKLIDVSNINVKKRIYIDPSKFSYDLYDINEYRKAFSSYFPSRSFNKILIENSSYTKKSHLKNKIISEYIFLTTVPSKLKSFFVPSFNLIQTKKYAMYSMPKINAFDASYLALNCMFNKTNTRFFFKKLSIYLSLSTTISSCRNKNSTLLFNKKIKDRVSDLQRSSNIKIFDRLIFSQTNFKSYKEFSKEIINYLSRNEKKLNSRLVFSHGDLCLSNILFDLKNDIFILIDPRGASSDDEKYLSIYYDFAKLAHSINYGYDWILSDKSNISLSKNGDLTVTHDRNFEEFNESFYNGFNLIIKKFKLDNKILDAVVCSLFLSMIPLHSESLKKQILFLLTAINIHKKLISIA